MAIADPPFTAEERRVRRIMLVRKFALCDPATGRALRHDAEPSFSLDRGSSGKIILVSQGYARRLAAAFAALGEDPQEEYVCLAGHWHLRQIARHRAYLAARRAQRKEH